VTAALEAFSQRRTLRPSAGALRVARLAKGEFMTATEELVDRAVSLRPLLEANELGGEADRRVSQASIDAITDAGLFRIMTPKRYGGYETDMRTHLATGAEIAKGDGAAGWITSLTNVCAWLVGVLPERAQDEVWGESPDTRTAGVTAPTATSAAVDGGLRVTGSWSWASGSLHAQWGLGGVPVVNAAGEMIDQALAFFPMSEARINDTWFMAGMRATGSNTIVVENIFVPNHRLLSLPASLGGVYGTEHKDEVLYRSAIVPVLAIILVGPMLGMATRALELVVEQAGKKGIAYTGYQPQSSSVTFQYQLAEAASKIDTAYLHAFRAADVIDADARAGQWPDRISRARARQDTGWVARHCKEAVDILMTIGGASSFADGNPLQKIWRDLNTCSRHVIVTPAVNQEIFGRALLDVEETATPLV
jgi:alkylation response protein AidB-like acyl-CoA dehydrogenase